MEHYPLIMPAHHTLDRGNVGVWIQIDHAVVKPEENSLQLGDDDIFIIAGISNDGPLVSGIRIISLNIPYILIQVAVYKTASEHKFFTILFIEVGLVIRSASIDIVQIKFWCAKVNQRIRVILLLEAARRIKSKVVVDKLAQIGISRSDSLIFFIIRLGFGSGGIFFWCAHGICQRL